MDLLDYIEKTRRAWAEKLALGLGLPPWPGETDRLYPGNESRESEEDHDLSYEDALLDAQIRRSLRSEFGSLEPPKGVFLKVLDSIETQFGSPGVIRRWRVALGCVLARARVAFMWHQVGRLASGGIAVALLIAFLNANGLPFPEPRQGAALPTVAERTPPVSKWFRGVEREDLPNSAALAPLPPNDVYVYDPAELGRPATRQSEKPSADPQPPVEYYDRMDGMGAQF